jgi:Family of unknown function (DUF6298)/Putative collagen-binding domain of a collagenase
VSRRLALFSAVAVAVGVVGCSAGEDDPARPAAKPPPKTTPLPPGPLRVLKANPRYFSDGRRPVYLTGSHVWWNLLGGRTWGVECLPVGNRVFDYSAYLDRLARYNHNFFRLWTFELTRWTECEGSTVAVSPQPWLRTGPGSALDGLPKFDLSKPNPAYYARLRSRVREAQRRKFYVSVMLFEGWSMQFADPAWRWAGHPFNAANNVNGVDGDLNRDGAGLEVHTLRNPRIRSIQERYVRRVVETVAGLDNVLFEIANESGTFSTPWQYHMIRYVKRLEARRARRHPVGMTYQNPHGANLTLYTSPAAWVSPAGGEPFLQDPPVADGRRVSISDTDHHCGICGDAQFPWKALTRGHNPIFMDPMDDDPEREAIRWALGNARHYALRMDLSSSRPRPDLASTRFCLAVPGRQYLVYQPQTGPFSVNLLASKRTFRVEWFEPSTGKRWYGTVQGGAHRTMTPPVASPVVLFLER